MKFKQRPTPRRNKSFARRIGSPRLALVSVTILAIAIAFVPISPVHSQSDNPGSDDIKAAEQQYLWNVAENSGFTNIDALRSILGEDIGWEGGEGKSALGFNITIGPETKPAPFITSDALPFSPIGGAEATYELANQPSYAVKLGPVNFGYKGARVRITESLPSDNSCAPTTVSLDAYSGWASEVIKRNDDTVDQRSSWVKGYLSQHIALVTSGGFVTCLAGGLPDPQRHCNADYVYRFSLHPPGGGRVIDFYQKPVEQLVRSQYNGTNSQNVCASLQIGALPPQYWSSDDSMWLDMRNPSLPVVHYADGSMEEFAPPVHPDFPPTQMFGCNVLALPNVLTDALPTSPLRFIDRNGNVSTYSFAATSGGSTETLTDSKGRQTILTFVNGVAIPRLVSVKVPAPAGNNPGQFLEYRLNWQTFAFDMKTVFPDITCPVVGGACGSANIDLVSSIQIPDGRSYVFQYSSFGNLTQVNEPSGAVRTYTYGDQTNTLYATNSIPLTTRPLKTADGTAAGCAIWTGQGVNLQKRGVISETVDPQGSGNLATMTTSYEHVVLPGASTDIVGASNAAVGCDSQVWRVVTMPDRSVHKQGFCTNALPQMAPNVVGPIQSHEWELGQETWTAGQGAMLSASYYGNKNTGALFYDFDAIPLSRILSAPAGDRRPNRTVAFKDGIASTTSYTYADTIDIAPSGGTLRNTKNLTSQSIFACSDLTGCLNGQFGSKLLQTDTTYFHPPPYFDSTVKNPSTQNRSILHLPQTTQVTDPARGLLARTDNSYDEAGFLAPSFAPNLDTVDIGSARGNVTTQTSYTDPSVLTTGVSSHNYYFDTGDVQKKVDPNGNPPTTMVYDFGACSATHTTLTNSVTNAKGHTTTTLSDCFTGAVLRVTDPNNQSVFTQYDTLGRAVETAGPSDTLTSIPGFTHDSSAPMKAGAAVGNGGNGPTTWIEYLALGVINQQRTVTHTKDGTVDGRYVKTFTDGLGRTIQTRSKIDPAVSGNNSEVVATIVYDGMGRVSASYVPVFAAASDSYAGPTTGALATFTSYDALGRTISVQPPGLPPTTTGYTGSGSRFTATVTDANGNVSETFTDLLGHVVQVSRQAGKTGDPACGVDNVLGGSWCTRTMSYDALGRLLRVTDEAFNQTTFVYDGLGRKTQMTDMDMGTWNYGYDANGNLVSQTDNKSQVIKMHYDALNRITWKDLPPNDPTPGVEDMTFCYDGKAPPCYP